MGINGCATVSVFASNVSRRVKDRFPDPSHKKEKIMRPIKYLSLAAVLATCVFAASAGAKLYYGRQYYSGWSYYPSGGYYYSSYYYKPYASYQDYNYHYCIYYTYQPRYVYYYNPYSKVYWGRFDTKGKEGEQYSLLAEKDRKEKLKDIPESAFPKPGAMPEIPESKDGVKIEPPPKELPKGEPKDLPKEEKKK
jgi:hypothetical protein